METKVILGAKEIEIEPMSIGQAFEVMYILRPHVPAMLEHESYLDRFAALINSMKENDQLNFSRMICIMADISLEELIEIRPLAEETFLALHTGLKVNSLPALIQFGHAIGVFDKGWVENGSESGRRGSS